MLEAQESTVARGKVYGMLNQGGQWRYRMACATHIRAPPQENDRVRLTGYPL